MHLIDLTLATPHANLALDEALLECVDAEQLPGGVVRFWESPATMVVVGRGTRIADEVAFDVCRRDGVPVLRRISGGMSIVAGPGCLMYAVVDRHPAGEANIDQTHRHVLDRMVAGLRHIDLDVEAAGTSDLAFAGTGAGLCKVSGNSLRMGRNAFLYHGTLLYDFDLSHIPRYLNEPPRSPEYRAGRRHGEFVANLPVDRATLAEAIAEAWQAGDNLSGWPQDRVDELVAARYSSDVWNLGR